MRAPRCGEGGDVGLGGGMIPHLDVHGGGENERRGRGERHGGEKIVGHAMGQLGKNVGGGRRDDQGFGGLGFGDVLYGGVRVGDVTIAVPQAGDDAVAGDAGKRQGSDEMLRGCGHRDVNVERLLLQSAHQFRCLVRGDAAGNANHDFHASDCTLAVRPAVRFKRKRTAGHWGAAFRCAKWVCNRWADPALCGRAPRERCS